MNKYIVWLTFYSKKIKVSVEAENEYSIIKKIIDKIEIDKIEEYKNDNINENLWDSNEQLKDIKNFLGLK